MNKKIKNALVATFAGAGALLLLTAGTATADGHIDGADIKDYSITKQKLKGDSVGTFETINRSLGGWDLRKDSVGRNVWTPHLRSMIEEWEAGEFSKPGPAGEDGKDGVDGKDGADGVSGYEAIGRNDDRVQVPAGDAVVIETLCASENSSPEQQAEVALGGGAVAVTGSITMGGSYPAAIEKVSEPDADDPAGRWGAKGWAVKVTAGPGGATVQPYVTCAAVN